MSLTGKTLSASYKDILQVDNSNSGVTTSLKSIKDGEGTTSCLSISDDQTLIKPQDDDTTTAFDVQTSSGTSILSVDTTNEVVKASGNDINIQYAHFGISNAEENWVANTHHALPFGFSKAAELIAPIFGTGTDPATTFTTSGVNGYNADELAICLWYLFDPIRIDAIRVFQGADAATGDTNRFHLMSYDFTSGATNSLTNGTLLAHSADTDNEGYEQSYLSSAWTIDSAAVASGKVVLAFLECDTIVSDYAVNVQIKYHLT